MVGAVNAGPPEKPDPPGAATLLHRHHESEELYFILAGTGRMTLGEGEIDVAPGDTLLIPPGTPHCLRNTGGETLRLLCACAPAYRHEDTEVMAWQQASIAFPLARRSSLHGLQGCCGDVRRAIIAPAARPAQMENYLLILIATVFVNNIVMSKILGLCPFMGVSRKLETAIGMGAATTFVLTLSSGASYLIDTYLLGQDLAYLRTLSFIVVIAGIVGFTEMFIKKTSPVLFRVLGIYLPLITTNCAVLGIPLLNVQEHHNFMESLFFGMGGALGFTLVLILFAAMRERLEAAEVPKPFKGISIAMITAGLMSLAFMGFAGLIK